MRKKKISTVVYCGPSIQNAGIFQYSTYSNGIPNTLSEILKEQPSLRALIVEPANLAKVRAKLEKKGSRESAAYYTAVNKFL